MSARRNLYKAARLMGDVEAIRKGRIRQRIENRIIGHMVSRVMRRVWR